MKLCVFDEITKMQFWVYDKNYSFISYLQNKKIIAD